MDGGGEMKLLEMKVGSGFAFLLYEAALIGLAIWLKPAYGEMALWMFAGLGFHSGQRAVTQVVAKKVEGEINKSRIREECDGDEIRVTKK